MMGERSGVGKSRQVVDGNETGFATTRLDALLGCPPKPEQALDGLLLLQDKIATGDRRPGVVKPRQDPVTNLVTLGTHKKKGIDEKSTRAILDEALAPRTKRGPLAKP